MVSATPESGKAVPEYNNAAWLLSYQNRSVLQTAKKIDWIQVELEISM